MKFLLFRSIKTTYLIVVGLADALEDQARLAAAGTSITDYCQSTNLREVSQHSTRRRQKAPTRAFSIKAPFSTFTIKNLLRHETL